MLSAQYNLLLLRGTKASSSLGMFLPAEIHYKLLGLTRNELEAVLLTPLGDNPVWVIKNGIKTALCETSVLHNAISDTQSCP